MNVFRSRKLWLHRDLWLLVNNLLLGDQGYLHHTELSARNFEIWKNIFSIVKFEIESVNIN
jgi:hypothetical protein